MKECPTLEQISSHCDCEDVPGIEEHLQHCGECRSAVFAFQGIDRKIQRESRPPPDLSAAILSACKADACPSVEALSSYFDGDGIPGLEEHVETCESCQAKLADFRRFDDLARESLVVPEGFSARVMVACKSDSCPSVEVLSEYYDGDRSLGLESHVEQCGECQEVMKSFAQLDQEIQKAAKVPETLVEGILTQVKGNVCPDAASLSAYYDGGETVGLKEHVEHCDSCQEQLRQFAVFDLAARRASAPPADFGKRVLQAVNKDFRVEEKVVPEIKIVSFWRQNLVRYAAAVVLTFGLGFVVVKNIAPSSGDPVAQKGHPAKWLLPGMNAENDGNFVNGRVPRMQNQQDVRPVTVDENGRHSTQLQKRQFLLNEKVSHIWMVDNPAEALTNLNKMLPASTKPHVSSSNEQKMTVKLFLPEEKLQALVDQIKKCNWDLVSSALPQPGEGASVRFQKRNILYTLELVKKDN